MISIRVYLIASSNQLIQLEFSALKVDHVQQSFKSLCNGSNTNQACILSTSLLLILVHSYHSWDKDKKGDHLSTSFEQFIKSSHSVVVTSAVEQAIKSYGTDLGLLCEAIIQIVQKHPLSHSTLTKTPTKADKVKKTVPNAIHGWWKHS
ncbi:hypothetical protein OG21DRAFT_219279 [Imleria badia]|nr:hypothetical protein OG21DRAFT_219279 [Imleria badia]